MTDSSIPTSKTLMALVSLSLGAIFLGVFNIDLLVVELLVDAFVDDECLSPLLLILSISVLCVDSARGVFGAVTISIVDSLVGVFGLFSVVFLRLTRITLVTLCLPLDSVLLLVKPADSFASVSSVSHFSSLLVSL